MIVKFMDGEEDCGFVTEWDAQLPRVGDTVIMEHTEWKVADVRWYLDQVRSSSDVDVWVKLEIGE